MSGSTNYIVSIDYQLSGDPNAKVGSLGRKLSEADDASSKLKNSISSLGSDMADAFTGAVEKVGSLALGLAKVGVVAGIAAVTYGVVGLNQELEGTRIALGAIFNAQGFAKSFADGVDMAGDTIAKMKQDVKSLPGDLGQLAGIFKTISTPGAQAGASVDQLRKLAGQTMVVGGVMGLDTGMASREMAMLLSGRAGAHNVLGTRLGFAGDAAKSLNAASPAERLAKVSAELAKYQPAIDAYSRSFTGLFTTLKDNVMYSFMTPATTPLFEGVKRSLTDINHWFDANQVEISTFSQALGSELEAAWEWGSKKVKEWLPLVIDFAGAAYDKLGALWEKVEPYVERLGAALKDALSDPNGTLDKLLYVLEAYAAVKIGGGILGVAGAAAPALGAAGRAVGAAGSWIGGIGETAAIAAQTSGGIGGVLSATVAEFGSSVGAMAVAAAPVVGALAAIGAAGYGLYQAFDQGSKLISEVSKRENGLARLEAGERFIAQMDEMDWANKNFDTTLSKLISTGDILNENLLVAAAGAKEFYDYAHKKVDKEREADDQRYLDTLSAGTVGMVAKAIGANEKAKAIVHPGGGGMTVQKVEIAVTSNQDPERIARRTAVEFEKWARRRSSSPDVRNFTASR